MKYFISLSVLLSILMLAVAPACGSHETKETITGNFTIGNLSINPSKVDKGERVEVSVIISNNTDISGNCAVNFRINGMTKNTLNTFNIPIAGNNIVKEVWGIDTVNYDAGIYNIDLNGLSGTFTVR